MSIQHFSIKGKQCCSPSYSGVFSFSLNDWTEKSIAIRADLYKGLHKKDKSTEETQEKKYIKWNERKEEEQK